MMFNFPFLEMICIFEDLPNSGPSLVYKFCLRDVYKSSRKYRFFVYFSKFNICESIDKD